MWHRVVSGPAPLMPGLLPAHMEFPQVSTLRLMQI